MKVELNIDPACPERKIIIQSDCMTEEIKAVLRLLSEPSCGTIAAQTGRGVELLQPQSILRVYAERQRVYAQTAEGVYPLKSRLYEMEQRLAGHGFVRVSNSELVSMHAITGMDFSLAGTIRLSLKGGITTYVSRRHVSEIKKLFDV